MEKIKSFKEHDRLKEFYIKKLLAAGVPEEKLKKMTIKELSDLLKDLRLKKLKK